MCLNIKLYHLIENHLNTLTHNLYYFHFHNSEFHFFQYLNHIIVHLISHFAHNLCSFIINFSFQIAVNLLKLIINQNFKENSYITFYFNYFS